MQKFSHKVFFIWNKSIHFDLILYNTDAFLSVMYKEIHCKLNNQILHPNFYTMNCPEWICKWNSYTFPLVMFLPLGFQCTFQWKSRFLNFPCYFTDVFRFAFCENLNPQQNIDFYVSTCIFKWEICEDTASHGYS